MTLASGRGTLYSPLSCCSMLVGQACPLGFFSFGPSRLMVWGGGHWKWRWEASKPRKRLKPIVFICWGCCNKLVAQKILPFAFFSFWQPHVFFGLWQQNCNFCLHLYMAFFPLSVSRFSFSYKDTGHIGLESTLLQYDLILSSLIISATTLFPTKVTF